MTLGAFQSHSDAGDLIAFASFYIPSLLMALCVFIILSVILLVRGKLNQKSIRILAVSIICCWGIYFLSKASQYMTLALLGSESAEAAEFAYQTSFHINLHQAIALATSPTKIGEENVGVQNVRFYAACRIADILALSNQDFQNIVLEQVQSAPIVTPGFIGTNSINCTFYIDDRAQPELQVTEIIQRRFLVLGKR